MRTRLLALSGLVLAACSHAPAAPLVRSVEVKVPVAVPCVPGTFPPAPVYPDTRAALIAAPTLDAFEQIMQAGWLLRDARLTALEAQVDACR